MARVLDQKILGSSLVMLGAHAGRPRWVPTLSSHAELPRWAPTLSAHAELPRWAPMLSAHAERPCWAREWAPHMIPSFYHSLQQASGLYLLNRGPKSLRRKKLTSGVFWDSSWSVYTRLLSENVTDDRHLTSHGSRDRLKLSFLTISAIRLLRVCVGENCVGCSNKYRILGQLTVPLWYLRAIE